MKLIVGCPVYEREWLLPHYFAAIEKQTFQLSDIGFVFIVVKRDKPTVDYLYEWHSNHPEVSVFDVVYDDDQIHRSHPEGSRRWTKEKYATMVSLRNDLLRQVRAHEPDRFFSLDSDVLLEDPNTLENLYNLADTCDAVSPLMYMTPTGEGYPDVMTWQNGPGSKAFRILPYPKGELFQADVIMAAKMMSKEVYMNVNYSFHRQGEDLGFCANAAMQGFKLYNAAYIYAAHIMHKAMLEDYLVSGDPRSPYVRT